MTTVENKIPSVNNFLSNTDFNTKVTEIEGKIPNIRGSATKTAVENKVSNVSNLAKMSKITEIEKKINDHKHDQYITTDEILESTTKTKIAATRIKKENLVNKTDFDTKLTNFNESINSNKLIYLLYKRLGCQHNLFDPNLPPVYLYSFPLSQFSLSDHSFFRLLILKFLHADLTNNSSKSFKYRAALVEKTSDAADGNSFVKNTKIDVPLKYLSNFWRSLEMPLVNCKIHLELYWIEYFI